MSRPPRSNRSSRDHSSDTSIKANPSSKGDVAGRSESSAEVDHRSPQAKFADKIRLDAHRETVEAFVVAFILALLFRAFIAEAFVIPTGSMAPTLMGAHKDISCDRCGKSFQFGASLENRGSSMDEAVVGGICPNCRHINALDLAGDANAATFSGDRILVSKFAYAVHDPQRWDVIVFKFPGNPKQNYIKRLVGLPNETITLSAGDVYAKPTGTSETPMILRKPPETLLAMRHLVYDTKYQSPELIAAKYPSRWQPWAEKAAKPPADSWQVERGDQGLAAMVKTSDQNQFYWLRYFHHWPSPEQWELADRGQSLANVNPYESRAITDFYEYDSYIHVNANAVYAVKPNNRGWFSGGSETFNASYQSGGGIDQFDGRLSIGNYNTAFDGMHWVGDLLFQADVETSAASRELMLEIVEAGVKYRCVIDLTTGNAKLKIDDSEPRSFDSGDGELAITPEASTPIRAGERHTIRMSNCDDQILLWVDDDVIAFDGPTTFDARKFRTMETNRPNYVPGQHPLDAAPVGLAVRGGECKVRHLRIDRDKYYIAARNSYEGLIDYDFSKMRSLSSTNSSVGAVQQVMADPQLWDSFVGWQSRREVTFEMQEDQFFPMGDNSPESQDARCWAGTKLPRGREVSPDPDAYRFAEAHYVPRDLLVGKALLVFWPHPWNRPIPYTPNIERMKLIR